MGQHNMSETKAFLRLVFGTLMVLGLLTAANVLMIMNSLGTDVFKPFQRNIAAVSTTPIVLAEKIRSPIIEINCQKKLDILRVKTKASSARIYFKNCDSIGRIVNESNNNQGDLFPLEKNLWTSDYIFLKEGKNMIKAPLGKETQSIEIVREVSKQKSPEPLAPTR